MNSVQSLKKQSQINGAQGIVSVMEREEVDKVFCVPGESYLPVMDAIYDSSTIELVSNRHEGGAAFMAEGYAKASGKVGVVMATRGVGGANLTIGVHTAYQDSTPMIVLLGQVHSKFRGREGFQEVDLDQFLNQSPSGRMNFKTATEPLKSCNGHFALHNLDVPAQSSFHCRRMC